MVQVVVWPTNTESVLMCDRECLSVLLVTLLLLEVTMTLQLFSPDTARLR